MNPNNNLPKDRINFPTQNPWNIIPLGVRGKENPLYLNLLSNPNILFATSRIHSASNVLNSIIAHSFNSDADWEIYGLDINREAKLSKYSEISPKIKIATNLTDAYARLESLFIEMKSRQARMKFDRAQISSSKNPILLIIEEMGIFDDSSIPSYVPLSEDQITKAKIKVLIQELVKGSGASKIFVVAGAVNPIIDDLEPSMKEQFSCILTVNDTQIDRQSAAYLFGTAHPRPLFDRNYSGRGYIRLVNERFESEGLEFQAFSTPLSTLKALISS